MTLRIGAAVQNGFARALKRNGLLLIGVFVVLGLVNAVVSQSLLAVYFEGVANQMPPGSVGAGFPPATPLAVLPVWAAGVIWFVMIFVSEAIRIVGVRTFVSEHTHEIPREFQRRNLPVATVNGVLAGTIAAVLIGIGSIFLLLPGLFLALSFFFFRQEVAVRDKSFVGALQDSWAIASGNRIALFLLALAVVIIGLVASIPGFIIGLAMGSGTILAAFVNVVTNGFVAVLGMAIAARAYVQLTDVGQPADESGEGGEGREVGGPAAGTGGAAGASGAADATGDDASESGDGIPLAGGDDGDGSDEDDDEWDDPPGVDV